MNAPQSGLMVVPPAMHSSLPLYQIEDLLAAYAETADLVPADQGEEFYQQFRALQLAGEAKIDKTGQFFAHLENSIQFADDEIKRLQERKRVYARVLERIEAYLIRILQSLGTDSKGKPKKLEGKTATFALRKNPPSVQITDETQIPNAYRIANVTVRLPAETWNALLDQLDLEARAQLLDGARVLLEPAKTAIKVAIDEKTEVPGAQLAPENYRLVRT